MGEGITLPSLIFVEHTQSLSDNLCENRIIAQYDHLQTTATKSLKSFIVTNVSLQNIEESLPIFCCNVRSSPLKF